VTGAGARAATWRDPRTVVLATILIAASAWAWFSVLHRPDGAMDMPGMPGMAAPALSGGVSFVAAWGVMMAAMMIPGAMPMFFLYRTVRRRLAGDGERAIPAELFAAAYLVAWTLTGIPVWGGYLLVARLADSTQWFAALARYLVAATLLAAGLYEWTDVKRACLAACESPLDFLMSRWRSGYAATLSLALRHATFCIGCCWGLTAILVVAGAMGIRWVVAIATLVLLEKFAGWGGRTSRLVGAALVLLGLAVATWPSLAGTIRS